MSHRRPDLHIVCLDDPTYPVYGGVIDMHYRIQSLASAGLRIYIHAFYKGQHSDPTILKQWAEEVYFYPRLKIWQAGRGAYMMASRRSDQLLNRLMQDEVPVLFEGLHTCHVASTLRTKSPNRKLFLRSHNIESHYYHDLYLSTHSWLKRIYFQREFQLLRKAEAELLPIFSHIWSISNQEVTILKAFNPHTSWLPAYVNFNPQIFRRLPNIDPADCTLLFHGNFKVAENINAASLLIAFMQQTQIKGLKLILAGKALHTCGFPVNPAIEYVSDPEIMDTVLSEADLIVLPGKQASGVKIKLLESLASGKRVICSPETASGSGLEAVLPVFHSFQELDNIIQATLNTKLEPQYLQVLHAFQQLYNPRQLTGQLLKEWNN